MNVNSWGPGLWIGLHCMALNYPINPTLEDKTKYKNFFELLSDMLPCKYCRQSYKIYLKYLPIDEYLDSRHGMCYWIYTLHNLVNEKVCKPNVTFDHAMKKYEKMRAKCGKINMVNKSFGSCQKNIIDNNQELDKFIQKTENKYGNMTKKYLSELYKSNENPNPKNKIIRYKLIKSS